MHHGAPGAGVAAVPRGRISPSEATGDELAHASTAPAGSPLDRCVERVVNTTIMLMSVLVLYDGWENLKLIGVVAVIVGPVLAMVLAHVFAASIARQVDLERTPTSRERTRIVRDESRFLLVAVPPVAIVVALYLGWSLARRLHPGRLVGRADITRILGWSGWASGRTHRLAPRSVGGRWVARRRHRARLAGAAQARHGRPGRRRVRMINRADHRGTAAAGCWSLPWGATPAVASVGWPTSASHPFSTLCIAGDVKIGSAGAVSSAG